MLAGSAWFTLSNATHEHTSQQGKLFFFSSPRKCEQFGVSLLNLDPSGLVLSFFVRSLLKLLSFDRIKGWFSLSNDTGKKDNNT